MDAVSRKQEGTPAMRTHTIDVDGIRQRHHVYGQGAATLVVMPGGPGIFWEVMRMPEIERHMRVVYVEPIGTGESGRLPTHPSGYTRAVYAESLNRVIADLGQERVYLLGHSYGGFVAQYYAARHPERLAGLVLYESSPVTGPEQAGEAVHQMRAFVRRNEGNPEVPDVLMALQSVGSATDDEQLTAVLRDLLPAYFAHYWQREEELAPVRTQVRVTYISGLDVDGNPDPVEDRELLAGIVVPTLVIAGRYDVVCGERWAREIHGLIPGSRLLILAESGHLGHVEEPERFTKAVIDFVAATKKSTGTFY
jgi:pimeloyl-ACP methyl ester carboxylesterase